MKVRKKLMALFSVLILVVGIALPKVTAHATSGITIDMVGATSITTDTHKATVSYDGGFTVEISSGVGDYGYNGTNVSIGGTTSCSVNITSGQDSLVAVEFNINSTPQEGWSVPWTGSHMINDLSSSNTYALSFQFMDKTQYCKLELSNAQTASVTAGALSATYQNGSVSATVENTSKVFSQTNGGKTSYYLYTKDSSVVFATNPGEGHKAYVESQVGAESTKKSRAAVENNTVTLSGLTAYENLGPQTACYIQFSFDSDEGGGGGGGGERPPFDGNAYFVWMDGDKVCYHLFENMDGGIDINYYNVNELIDQSGNNGKYVWGQENANWVLKRDMDKEGAAWTKAYIFGDGDRDMGVQLNPCGAPEGPNSISTNGDMNFKATIFREGYNALKFANSLDDYTYFPGFMDPTFYFPTVDISGTTAENPAVFKTYLLESRIQFRMGEGSEATAITAATPLNVNPGAMSVTVNDGIVTITFNSNYFDHTVFEVTTLDGKKSYIQIARVTMTAYDNFAPGVEDTKIIGELNFPLNTSAADYEVVGTVVNKDGSSVTTTLSQDKSISIDINPNSKGLDVAFYSVPVDKENLAGVYFNVVKKGALEGETFGGTFSGSGKGIYYNAATRQMEFGK